MKLTISLLCTLALVILMDAPGQLLAQESKSPETQQAYLQFQRLYQSHQKAMQRKDLATLVYQPHQAPDSVFIMPLGTTPRLLPSAHHPLTTQAPAGIISKAQAAVLEAAIRRGECRVITIAIDPHDPVLYELRHGSQPHDHHSALSRLHQKASNLSQKYADPDDPAFVRDLAQAALGESMAQLFKLSPLIAELAQLDAILVTGAFIDTRSQRLYWVGADNPKLLFQQIQSPSPVQDQVDPLKLYNAIQEAHRERENKAHQVSLDQVLWIQSAQSSLDLDELLGPSSTSMGQLRQLPGLYDQDVITQMEMVVRLRQPRLLILSMNTQHPMITGAINGQSSQGLLTTPTRNLLIIKDKLLKKKPNLTKEELRHHMARQLLLHQIKLLYAKSEGLRQLDRDRQLLIVAAILDDNSKSLSIEGIHPQRNEMLQQFPRTAVNVDQQWKIWKKQPRLIYSNTQQPVEARKPDTMKPTKLKQSTLKTSPVKSVQNPELRPSADALLNTQSKGQPSKLRSATPLNTNTVKSNQSFRIPGYRSAPSESPYRPEPKVLPKAQPQLQPKVTPQPQPKPHPSIQPRPTFEPELKPNPQPKVSQKNDLYLKPGFPLTETQSYFSGRVELSHVTLKHESKSSQTPELITQILIAKPKQLASNTP